MITTSMESRPSLTGACINNVVATKSSGFFGASSIEDPGSRSHGTRKTSNEVFVEKNLCEAIAEQDIKRLRQFAASNSTFQYMGGSNGLTMDFFITTLEVLFESFPDHSANWDYVTEVEPGKVFVKGFYGEGSHTGKPYAFGPYEAIPAKHLRVKEAPCNFYVTISKKGKITRFVMESKDGYLNGPAGFYAAIGGRIG